MKLYDASPECRERQCRVIRTEDIASLRFVYQHGNNLEAVLLVDRFSERHDPAGTAQQQFRAFAERCHRYEEGRLA